MKIATDRHEVLTSFIAAKFSSAKLLQQPWQV
jgi:hypothetical protein